jgi:DNA-binding NarL/FixJ family response regulator
VSTPLRILVADDHPVFRMGLSALLTSLPDATVVGEAADGEQAVRMAAEHAPDLVVMDLDMPGVNGVEATKRILAKQPNISILMLTMFDDDDSVFAAMRAGALGYLIKGSGTEETIRAIAAVGNGDAIFGPSVARRILAFLTEPLSAHDELRFPELTGREREVLDLIASGAGNAAIAQQLFLSPKTIRNLVSSIFSKLQVADRAQAIVRARTAGLGLRPRDGR